MKTEYLFMVKLDIIEPCEGLVSGSSPDGETVSVRGPFGRPPVLGTGYRVGSNPTAQTVYLENKTPCW